MGVGSNRPPIKEPPDDEGIGTAPDAVEGADTRKGRRVFRVGLAPCMRRRGSRSPLPGLAGAMQAWPKVRLPRHAWQRKGRVRCMGLPPFRALIGHKCMDADPCDRILDLHTS